MSEELELIISQSLEGTALVDVSNDIEIANKSADQASKQGFFSLKKVGDLAKSTLTGLAVGGLALVGTGAVAMSASVTSASLDAQKSIGEFQSELGVTADEAEHLKNVALDVFGNNFGDSVLDAKDTIVQVRQQLGDLAEDELQYVTEGALALRDAFDSDVSQSVNAVKALMENFGISSTDALDMIANGMQAGLNANGDFLESITEYSNQFKEGGASADEFFNIMASGLGTGILGTDKAGDLFKEFVVRIQDGSKLTVESLEMLGLDAEQILTDLANDTIQPIDAFDQVQTALANTDDEAKLMQAGVGLLGTKFEDLGASAVKGLDMSSGAWADQGKAIDQINKRYDNFQDLFQGVWREATVALVPVGEGLLSLANDALPYVSAGFEFITEKILASQEAFGDLMVFYQENQAAIDTLAVVIASMATSYSIVTTAVWAWITAKKALTVAQLAFNLALSLSPIGWVILGLGALIAIGILLWKNWDQVTAGISAGWSWLTSNLSKAWNFVKTAVVGAWMVQWNSLKAGFDTVTGGIEGAWSGLSTTISSIWNGIKNTIKGGVNFAIDGVNKLINGINGIKFTAPDWVPAIGGQSWSASIPNVPRFAKGGSMMVDRPTLMMVGDNPGGREQIDITPLSGSNINGRGGKNNPSQPPVIQLVMNGPVFDPVEFFRQFKREAEQAGYQIA